MIARHICVCTSQRRGFLWLREVYFVRCWDCNLKLGPIESMEEARSVRLALLFRVCPQTTVMEKP